MFISAAYAECLHIKLVFFNFGLGYLIYIWFRMIWWNDLTERGQTLIAYKKWQILYRPILYLEKSNDRPCKNKFGPLFISLWRKCRKSFRDVWFCSFLPAVSQIQFLYFCNTTSKGFKAFATSNLLLLKIKIKLVKKLMNESSVKP